MRKFITFGMAIIFALFSFTACGEKSTAPKAGSAKADDMLGLIPKDVRAIFFIDFHRVMGIEVVSKALKENKSNKEYQEFIEKTGIDPQKDIYFIAGGVSGEMEKAKQKAVVIINLKYNKDSLFPLIKEKIGKEEELREEEYKGFKIYIGKKGEEGPSFCFVDNSNILAGDAAEVKSVIDILQKKGENVFKSEPLSALIVKTNKEALLWGAVVIPPEAMDKIVSTNSMLNALKAINAASFYFDYRDKNIMAEIKAMSSDASKNQELADYLNNWKTIGSLLTIQDFNLGEVLNKIEITPGPDHVRIYINFPETFIEELTAKFKKGKETKPEKK
jgi:hypothetical protein